MTVHDITELDDETHAAFIEEHATALVLYHATWCGWCQQFKPVYESLRTAAIGKCAIGIVNSKHSCAADVTANGVPVVVRYADGKEVDRFEGYASQEKFMEWVNGSINQ